MEIERKFIVSGQLPALEGIRSARLRQGYLAAAPEGEVRLRESDDRRTLTVKAGSGLAREEREISLTAEQFEALWPATAGQRLEKRRYFLMNEDLLFELDIYDGDLAGLQVVEVEFDSREAAHAFTPPGWFGAEVTENPAYKNAALAVHGDPAGVR